MIRIFALAAAEDSGMLRKALTALSVAEEWLETSLATASGPEEWNRLLNREDLADVLICDVCRQGGVEALREGKRMHPEARAVPIADESVPPGLYVCPEIAPYSLIWKPIREKTLKDSLRMALGSFREAKAPEREEGFFCLETRKSVRRIPWDAIWYFEAREKRVFLRLKNEELAMSDTLGHLEEQIPETFLRCHKSFLVNLKHVRSADRINNLLLMEDGIEIPISRSFKKQVLEKMYG